MRHTTLVVAALLTGGTAHASHFIIAGGDKDPATAQQLLEDYLAAGHPSHGAYPQVIESASVQGFNAGFHIVVVGEAFEKAVADKALVELKRRGWKGGYVKEAKDRKGEFLVLATVSKRACAKGTETATAEGPEGARAKVTLMNGAGTLFVTEDNDSRVMKTKVLLKVTGCPDLELAKGTRLFPGFRGLISRPSAVATEDYGAWSSDFMVVAQQTGFAATEINGNRASLFRFGTVVKKVRVDDGAGYVIVKEGEPDSDVMHDLPGTVVPQLEAYFGVSLNVDGMPWARK